MDIDQPEASTSTGRPARVHAAYDPLEPLSSSFVVDKSKAGNTAFRNQYASVYFSRLMALKKRVKENAERKWKDVVKKNPHVGKSQRVLDITQGQLCFVIGTIYMEMRLKPNILEELAREQYIQAPPPRPKFLSDDDEVMLEDESGRVRLVGKVMEDRKFPLVTGVIAAVLGAETPSGDFEVADMCFAGMPPQPSTSTNGKALAKHDAADDPHIALISGLELGTQEQVTDYRVGLLAEWLLGEGGGDEDVQQARQVARVVLAGNSMTQPVRNAANDSSITNEKKPRKTYGYDSSVYSSAPTIQLDRFLADLLETVNVDLMCGEKDPNGTTLPQQLLHEALLPKAGEYQNFRRQTNPCWFELAGRSFLGCSGQSIDDIFKYLDSPDRISMACSTLEWSHMAPTAPDTLCEQPFKFLRFCYPFQDRDPFILTRSPDVYFIGNQPHFESRLYESDRDSKVQSRVVLVPKFCETGQIVLLNCRTLECRVLQFGADLA